MPKLSPAAQAVLDTMHEVNMDFDGENATLAAAALRAAATMLRDAYLSEEYVDPADDWLDDIAAELKSHD